MSEWSWTTKKLRSVVNRKCSHTRFKTNNLYPGQPFLLTSGRENARLLQLQMATRPNVNNTRAFRNVEKNNSYFHVNHVYLKIWIWKNPKNYLDYLNRDL